MAFAKSQGFGDLSGKCIMSPRPHVRSLKVQNYKGIAKLELSLDESLTLLAGVNGVGKTSVLEAFLGAVTNVWSLLSPNGQEAWFSPKGDLLRYGAREGSIAVELVLETGESSFCTFQFRENDFKDIRFSEEDVAGELEQEASPMPLVVYYDQNRIGGLGTKNCRLYSDSNRKNALDTTPHTLSDFKKWYFEKESDEAREAIERSDLKYTDTEVQAVREILKNIAGKSVELRTRKPDGSMDRMLFLQKKGGHDIPFEALSGGEQAYFLLAVDLARRLLLEFPGTTLSDAPGLVCIDEIELHLHPEWQRGILKSLMELFPRCQFVVSTHSPQVIGSVSAQHVRLLKSNKTGHINVTKPIASLGRDSNYILEGIMDTPEQEPSVDKLFLRFDKLVDDGLFDQADQILDKLENAVEGSSSRIAVRRAKCKRQRRAAG